MGSTAAPAVVFDAPSNTSPMFPARALETAREARALPPIVHPKLNTGKEALTISNCELRRAEWLNNKATKEQSFSGLVALFLGCSKILQRDQSVSA